MRWLIATLLIASLAGCAEPGASCEDLAALRPAGNLPLDAFFLQDDEAMAHELAEAVGDELTGQEGQAQFQRFYLAEQGNVSIVRIPTSRDTTTFTLRYTTQREWTNAYGMVDNLRDLARSLGLDAPMIVAEEGQRDAQKWAVIQPDVGGRPAGVGLAVDTGMSWQQISIDRLPDLSAMAEPLPDEELARLGVQHASCSPQLSKVDLVQVRERSVYANESLFREIVVSVDNGCARVEGRVLVDMQTGARGEPFLRDAFCDD